MSTFEDRLWSQLVDEHGDQIRARATSTPGVRATRRATVSPTGRSRATLRRRRRPAIVTGTALASAGLVAAGIVAFSATTSAPPAYAVTTDPDGSVTVTLVPADIPAGYTAIVGAAENASGQVVLLQGAVRPPVPACFNNTPMALHPINLAHASPAVRATLAKARQAAQAAGNR
jgi:hypothetical protein